MQNPPLLTIVVPAYNVEKTIKKALQFILSGSYKSKIELLVVNDGSTDDTSNIISSINADNKNKNVDIVVKNKENGGHGSVLNYGIKNAKGKYLRILDGDDYCLTKGLEQFLKRLEKETSDLVISDYVEEQSGKSTKKEWYKEEFENKPIDEIDLLNTGKVLLPFITAKTSVLRKADYRLDEKCYYDDQEFNFLVLISTKTVSYVKESVYVYRIGSQEQSIAKEGFIRHIKDHETICARLLADYSKIKENLSAQKQSYIERAILIELCHLQYRIAIYLKKSRSDFLSFDATLKQYPNLYNNQRIAGRKIKLHRLTKGILI